MYKNNETFDYLLERTSSIFDSVNIQDVYIISDTHFYHNKIAEYCGRPENWQDMIIENWNSIIGVDDIVLHLGDFAIIKGFQLQMYNSTKKEMIKNLVDKLNGKIYLIKGNHDRHSVGFFRDTGITLIKKPFVIEYSGEKILFSHKFKPCKSKIINVHGHWHQKSLFIFKVYKNYHINMSVEQTMYKPIQFKNLYRYLHFMKNNI